MKKQMHYELMTEMLVKVKELLVTAHHGTHLVALTDASIADETGTEPKLAPPMMAMCEHFHAIEHLIAEAATTIARETGHHDVIPGNEARVENDEALLSVDQLFRMFEGGN